MRMAVFASALGVLAFGATAHASVYEVKLYQTGIENINADLFVTLAGRGAEATAITGERDGIDVTGLSDYLGADNEVFLTGNVFTGNGLSFVDADGDLFNEHYQSGLGYLERTPIPDGYANNYVGVSVHDVTAVPEPPALALFASGLLGLAFAGRRKRAGSTRVQSLA